MEKSFNNASKVVYFHINPIKNEIFYIGIGNKTRPYSKNRSKGWYEIVSKYEYDVIIIQENLSWDEACIIEKKYIKQIGRKDLGLGSLVNLTNGGEGGGVGRCTKLRDRYKFSLIYKSIEDKQNQIDCGFIYRNKLKRKLREIDKKIRTEFQKYGI